MADTYDPLDPRSDVWANAHRTAEQAKRNPFAEIKPKPAPGSTPVGMLRRALLGDQDDTVSDR